MAQLNNPTKVVLDGIELNDNVTIMNSLYSYDLEIAQGFTKSGRPNITVIIKGRNVKIECQPIGMLQEGNTLYLYGPLRDVFPELFAGKLLLPWQEAYLKARADFQSLDLYRYWRDDGIFETLPATYFHKGYKAAIVDNKKGKA